MNVATHVNGKLDVVGLSCTSCHGDPGRPKNAAAPPLGTHGETATTERAVGAHQAHLDGAALGTPIACDACHTVPTALGHANGTVDLTFGALATADGTFTAAFNGATCATYCHGATLGAGGSNTAPRWTGGSGEAACGSCHAVPPPSPHPSVGSDLSGCSACHPQTMSGGALIPASAGGKHLDGLVEATLERLVDFDRINDGGMRLTVSAVNVATGNFEIFDSHKGRYPADEAYFLHCLIHFFESAALKVRVGKPIYERRGHPSGRSLEARVLRNR